MERVRDVANWLVLDLKFLMEFKTVNFQTLNYKWSAKNDLIGASWLNQDVALTGIYWKINIYTLEYFCWLYTWIFLLAVRVCWCDYVESQVIFYDGLYGIIVELEWLVEKKQGTREQFNDLCWFRTSSKAKWHQWKDFCWAYWALSQVFNS